MTTRLAKTGKFEELFAPEYKQSLESSGNYNLIDVRSAGEYESGHIDGAVNISYFGGHFMDHLDSLNLDKNRPMYIYCETQHRSPIVAKKMVKQGYVKVIDLDKGFSKWKKQGFPMVVEE